MAICSLFKCPVLFVFLFASALLNVGLTEEPTFTQCRVHIEAAMKGVASEEAQPESPVLPDDQPLRVEESTPVEPVSTDQSELEEEHHEVTPYPEEDSEEHHAVSEEDGNDEVHEEEEEEDHADEDANDQVEEEQEDDQESEEGASHEEHPAEESELVHEEPVVEEPVHEEVVVEEPVPEPVAEVQIEEPIVVEEPAIVQEEVPVASEPEPVATSEPVEPEAVAEPVQEAAPPAPETESAPAVEETVEAAPEPVEAAPVIVDDPSEGSIEEAPEQRRSRDHIDKILRLGEDAETDKMREGLVQSVLKDIKRLIENSVRSLEGIFNYNDVSNRNFGDPEIFSKPLVLFLGPWSGGKSSIINYLLGNEFTQNSLKTGAEPSATFFQILMYGEHEEMLDGTQLAADWTFSGLQKYGQAFIDRLRGKRLPNKLLEKANVVEVPGIMELRKQVDRPYPFNDVVQWFIDRADIIFVVYDPTKLDTGLEHEALFDQLKGRQNQVRVLLNKADSVTQEELLLIQNNLVWNLSPLMASPLPPTLYAGSFWSKPYKPDAPVRLLRAHEENMLKDLRDTLDNVVENTIAEARRHAVRVRNHAKMVDCYLTTFFNQRGFFGNKKAIADDIIENPHAYHIFEGLSTLSNISRYDLPDAEVYKDFFRLHPLYDFKPLASTCTFFRGCPLDKLDTAIAYDLPELVGKYKKRLQSLKTSKKGKH